MTSWTSLLRRAALLARGPCPVCAASRSAPLCRRCRLDSGVATAPLVANLGEMRSLFVGAYRALVPGPGAALSPLGRALGSFKDQGDRYAGRCLADVLAEICTPAVAAHDIVVPVPADPQRLRRRACSPSAWLARELARRSRLPFVTTALRRVDRRPPQRELGGAMRRRNAQGAFGLGRAPVRGYAVVLVDDVATTGATLGDATRCLREGGAASVLCVVLACADDEAIAQCRSTTGNGGSNATARPRA